MGAGRLVLVLVLSLYLLIWVGFVSGDVYFETEATMAKQQFVRCWDENHVWQKFLFEMVGLSIDRHKGSTALFQSLPWNSIRPSFHDSLWSTSPPVTPWGCLCRSGSRSQGCPWPHRSHGRASCGCCQNRPRVKDEMLLPGWINTWAEQSDAVGREETVEDEAATPVPLAPSLSNEHSACNLF